MLFLLLAAAAATFPFEGQVITENVRVRSEPSTKGIIVKELKAGEHLRIVGEYGDFFAVQPEMVWVYGRYVSDGQITGDHVNVRLHPDLQSPVVATLNKGDKVTTSETQGAAKWVAITPPSSVHFYVTKKYITAAEPVNTLKPWQQKEILAYEAWANQNAQATAELWSDLQNSLSTNLTGTIVAYKGSPHAPGNFLLMDGDKPLAFLYSAQIDLHSFEKKTVSLKAVARSNQQFSLPAYSVLSVTP